MAVALPRLGPQTLDLILSEEHRKQAERHWHRPAEKRIERSAELTYSVLNRVAWRRRC